MARKKTKWRRIISRKLPEYGETDWEEKLITINPSKGDLVNTVIHEELHRKFPNKSEGWIRRKSRSKERTITISEVISLLIPYSTIPFKRA